MNGHASERDCPSDELLACWMEHRVSDADREAIERHVAGCATCADVTGAALPAADDTLAGRVADTMPVASVERTPARAGRRDRAPRTRWAVAAGLVLATAALAYAALDAGLGRVRDELARRATVALGEPVAIGRLGLGLTSDLRGLVLRLRDVRIGSDDALSAEGIELRLSLAALASRTLDVQRLRLLGPVIHVGGPPKSSPGAAARPGHTGGANAVAAALGTTPLEIVDGTLVADASEGALRIEHVNGTAAPDGATLVLTLGGTSVSGTVNVEGSLPASGSGDVAINVTGQALDVAQLPFTRDHLTGHADLTLALSGTTDAPIIQGHAVVHGGRARGWNPLPQALTALGAAVPPNVGGVTGPDLAFDELRVAVLHNAQGWKLPRLYASAPGFTVDATAVQLQADERLDGLGTLQLTAPLAAVVVAAAPSLAAQREENGTLAVPITIGGTLAAPQLVPVAAPAPPEETAPAPDDEAVPAPGDAAPADDSAADDEP
jgi:hypothetical protein